MGKISGEEGWISLGQWGGNGGVYSTYKPDGPIMQITIRHGDVIDSILFESKNRDGVVIGCSTKIGGMGGGVFAKFCIDSLIEHFSSISLTYKDHGGHVVLSSLCFNTNLKKYGPFGLGGGHSVFIPIEGGVIAGFHGRGGLFLDAIGIFVPPKVDSFPSSQNHVDSLHSIQDSDSAPTQLKSKISSEEGWISLGPWGGKAGVYSTYKSEGSIMQITICYGEVIDSILFESKSRDGVVIGSSVKIGGTGGSVSTKFCIDSSVEQLSSISLTYGDHDEQVTIISLCFITNLKTYGPFGTGTGSSSLYIPLKWEVVVGFHGRGGYYLTAIGIFVAPKVNNLSSSERKFESLHSAQDPNYAPTQLQERIIREEGWISLGPWGGKGGVYSIYKSDGHIMQITIVHGNVIDSILFESKSRDGVVIGRSVKIGGTGGGPSKFCIDSSVERLTSISLTYNNAYRGDVILTSLCFITNVKKYGPFGLGGGHSVSIPIEGGVITGFHGRGGSFVNAIGIFVAPKVDSFPNSEKNVNSLQAIQDPNFPPTQLKVSFYRIYFFLIQLVNQNSHGRFLSHKFVT